MRSYVPQMANYAVCTHFSVAIRVVHGVILKEVNPCQLIKMGNFETLEDFQTASR